MLTVTPKLARGGNFLEEVLEAWKPKSSPRSFEKKKRSEVEVHGVDTGLGARTEGKEKAENFEGRPYGYSVGDKLTHSKMLEIAKKRKRV